MTSRVPSNWFYTTETTQKPYIVAPTTTFPNFQQNALYRDKYSIEPFIRSGAILPATNTKNYSAAAMCYPGTYPPSFIGALCDSQNRCTGE